MSSRIYLVTDRDTQAVRLIRASSQAQAIRHAVAKRFNAEVASQDHIVLRMLAGDTVETAGTVNADEADAGD
jgi:hypothetical protein